MTEILPDVRLLVRERVQTMDHVEVLMRLHAAPSSGLTTREVEEASRLGADITSRSLRHLVEQELVRHDPAADRWTFAPKTVADRRTVEALATMYNQRPVTLVKLIYERPDAPIKLFSDAFRIRTDEEEAK